MASITLLLTGDQAGDALPMVEVTLPGAAPVMVSVTAKRGETPQAWTGTYAEAGFVVVTFTNDYYAGSGPGQDRNAYVVGVAVDGEPRAGSPTLDKPAGLYSSGDKWTVELAAPTATAADSETRLAAVEARLAADEARWGAALSATPPVPPVASTPPATPPAAAPPAAAPPAPTTPTPPAGTVPAVPASPNALTIAIGSNQPLKGIAQALFNARPAAATGATVTILFEKADPTFYAGSWSDHYISSLPGAAGINWPPQDEYIGGNPVICQAMDPGKGLVDVMMTDARQLYYGKGGVIVTSGDFTCRWLRWSGFRRGDVDGNLAAIRVDGGNGTANTILIEDCEFFNNDDALLVGANPLQTMTLRRVYIHECGVADGHAHNAYIGNIASVTLEDVLSTNSVVGHLFKSRAMATTLTRVRLLDPTGTSSYALDCPNGGVLTVTDSVLHRGAGSVNRCCLAFGEEGANATIAGAPNVSSITVRNTQFLSAMPGAQGGGIWNAGGAPMDVQGSTTFGLGIGLTTGFFPNTISAAFPDAGATVLTAMPALDLSTPVRLTL